MELSVNLWVRRDELLALRIERVSLDVQPADRAVVMDVIASWERVKAVPCDEAEAMDVDRIISAILSTADVFIPV
jgi:hypothetical protein